MEKITVEKKRLEDIGGFFDLLKSEHGIIETLFLKPDGKNITKYHDSREEFVKSVVGFNHHGFTCYAGLHPRNPALIKSDRAATGTDVTAMRLLAVDLDAIKPKGVNANDREKQSCLSAAEKISAELTNGCMAYRQPVMMDSGSGCWLLFPIP